MENDIQKSPKTRLAYIDNLRTLVIILVITMHSAVTYSGLGDWYYKEGAKENLSVFGLVFFGFLQSFLQAWIMGLLFFISAFLAAKALAKRTSFNFIKERLFRLGLPLLIYVFVISPIIIFIILGNQSENTFIENYIQFIIGFWWLDATGPLWFVQVLLFFSIVYAILKKFVPRPIKINKITNTNIISAILLIGVIAFFVRLKFPMGTSFLNLQFSYFTSYIVMFISGIIIGENDLLDNITDIKNTKCLKWALIAGTPLWAATMILGGALEGKEYFNGGFYWQSFTFSLWESITAIGFSMGLLACFKKKVNLHNKFTNLMRDNAFGIYVFHAPILIMISLMLKNLVLDPIFKFIMVTILASIISFIFSFLIRKIKPIGVLFK